MASRLDNVLSEAWGPVLPIYRLPLIKAALVAFGSPHCMAAPRPIIVNKQELMSSLWEGSRQYCCIKPKRWTAKRRNNKEERR